MAKIADLGMARIVPSLRASTMTKAPGASIYMPPEALEDESKYDVNIDIFSFGVLAIFSFSQMFPKPLEAAYMDDSGRMVGRTELERRGNYMQEVRKQFREGHPLVQMIKQCLENRMRERPTIQQVMEWLDKARAEVEDGEYDVNKLSLAQLLQSRNKENHSLRENILQQQENRSLRENIQQQQQEVRSLRENILQQQENRSLRENIILQQQQEIHSLREIIHQQKVEETQMLQQSQQGQTNIIFQDKKQRNDVQKLREENKMLQAGNRTKSKVFYVSFAILGVFLALLLLQFVSQSSPFCMIPC